MKFFTFFLLAIAATLNILAQKPQLVIQSGHQSEILLASISPDGKYILSSERDALTILWEINSGRQLVTFKDVMAAGFSSDGTSIELVTDDYSFRKTDYTGKVLHTYPSTAKGSDRMNRIIYNYYPGKGFLDMNGALFDREKGLVKVLNLPRYSSVHHYSEGLNQIAVQDANQVTLCHYPSGEIARTIDLKLGREDGEGFVQISPDTKWLVAGNRKDLDVVDLTSGTVKYSFKYGNLSAGYRSFELINATFSGDSRSMVVWTPTSLIWYDLLTGKEKWKVSFSEVTINQYGSSSGVLMFTPDNKKILLGGQKKLAVVDASGGRLEQVISGSAIAWLDASMMTNNDQQLVVKSGRKYLINWNLASGAMENAIPTGDLADCFDVSGDGKSFFIFPDRAFAKRMDASGKVIKEYEGIYNANRPTALLLSQDGKFLATTGVFGCDTCRSTFNESQDLYVYEALTGKRLLERRGKASTGAFANTSNMLAIKDEYDKYPLQVLEIPGGKVMFELKLPDRANYPSNMFFSPTDKYLAFRAAFTYIVELSSKKVITIDNKLPSGKNVITSAFTPDEKYYVMGSGDGKLYFWDIAGNSFDLSLTMDISNIAIEGISFTRSGRFMFVNSQENFIQLWDLQLRKLAATLYPNTTTNDWAVITPDGRFDASQRAQSYMFYLRGLEIFPLSVLFEQFYTPDLLPRLLAGEVFPPVEVDINSIRQAPTVEIKYQEGEKRNLEVADDDEFIRNTSGVAQLVVNAYAKNDKIDEIRLFHNGKVVNLATRGMFVEDNDGSDSKNYTVNLLPGKNVFRALALNSQRTESEPKELEVWYSQGNTPNPAPAPSAGSTPVDPVDKTATLHLIVVGINQYQNKEMSLNYALADASAFKMEIEKDVKTVLSSVATHFITDGLADKKGMEEAFRKVSQQAKPLDVMVFYYAGHGVIGKDKEFYLVPFDVSNLKNVQEELQVKGFPSALLRQYAVDIPAQKQLFIIDACQSAGAFESMLSENGDQQKSIALAARSTGTHWMAASGAQQYANEFSQLGHGAFTYVMLQALKGSAAVDKMITVNGLKGYIEQGVPELMKKYSGTMQYPASYGFGNDFPLEILK